MKFIAGLCAALLLLAPGASAADYEIALIPKGSTHEFWKSVHAGGAKAADELGIDLIWQGPQKEDDREMQIQVVQNFISRGVDAIVLAPLDEAALMRPVRNAMRRNIKVVVIDSGLRGDDYVSFVATDNYKGGQMAAEHMAKLLGGKGKVILLRYAEGSASTSQREQGFLDRMKEKHPGIEFISTNQYAGVTRESAFQKSQSMLARFGDVDAVYCPCEPVTAGMLRALETSGKAGEVKVVGFDASDQMLQALRQGHIHGLMLQNPFKMGYLGVKTAYEALQGKDVKPRIDTGVVLVTVDNMDSEEVQEYIDPPLEKWLD